VMAVMAVSPGLAPTLVLGLALGVASITFMVSTTSIVQIRALPDMRGRVLALQAMLFFGSKPIGGPIVGWVAEQWGARYSLALGAWAALGTGMWGLAASRRREVPAAAAVARDDEPPEPVVA